MSPDEYRHESERAHERRIMLREADEILRDVTKEARVQRHKPTEQLADAMTLILRAVERLSFADERTLEMRRECSAMIEHCMKAIQLDALSKPQTIVIAREELKAFEAARDPSKIAP